MLTLELTKQEQIALLQLLDIAVKAGGLPVAEASIQLAQKIQAATEAVNKKEDQHVDEDSSD